MRQQFDMDAKGELDFEKHNLEEFPADFGYITVFKLDTRFYQDGGVRCEVWNSQDAPKHHENTNEIFARKSYETLGFRKGQRDAYIFNTGCFQKARMRPVMMMKVVNPYGYATTEEEKHSQDIPALVRRISGGNPHGSGWDAVRRSLTRGALGAITKLMSMTQQSKAKSHPTRGLSQYLDQLARVRPGLLRQSSAEIVEKLSQQSLWCHDTIASLTRTLSDMAKAHRERQQEEERVRVRLERSEKPSRAKSPRKQPRRRKTEGLFESTHNGPGYGRAMVLSPDGKRWKTVRPKTGFGFCE